MGSSPRMPGLSPRPQPKKPRGPDRPRPPRPTGPAVPGNTTEDKVARGVERIMANADRWRQE